MSLDDLSAATVAFSLLIYLLLDGTDLGVGSVILFFDDEQDRRRLVQSILPVWDPNETWLVLTAGALLALFPAAYSQIFNAIYVPLFLMFFSLFGRALALEYRGQASSRVKRWLDFVVFIASFAAGFLQGYMAGLLVSGLPGQTEFSWLSGYALISGLGMVWINSLLACCWIRWRVGDQANIRARQLSGWLLGLTFLFFIFNIAYLPAPWQKALSTLPGKISLALVALCWAGLVVKLKSNAALSPLIFALLMVTFTFITLMTGMYPWLIPGTLTLSDASSGASGQYFLLAGIAIIMPLTLAYNSWAFWVFRGRVK